MSRNYGNEINLYQVWPTKTSAPLLADSVKTLPDCDLPCVIEYVRNQREHHATEAVHDRLECNEPLKTERQLQVAQAGHSDKERERPFH